MTDYTQMWKNDWKTTVNDCRCQERLANPMKSCIHMKTLRYMVGPSYRKAVNDTLLQKIQKK